MQRKAVIAIVVVCILAVAGAIVGIVVWKNKSKSSNSKSSDGNSDNKSATGGSGSAAGGGTSGNGSGGGTNSNSSASTITSDPTKVTYTMSFFAVGDWGTTLVQDSCCTRRAKFTANDEYAEDIVAALMDRKAGEMDLKPQTILGHGDNFYWTGVSGKNGANGQTNRFQTTFEAKFTGNNLKDIPWVNVLGNHDYGGADFICFDDNGNNVKCSSASQLTDCLSQRYQLQASYVSPNGNRWVLKDHYYKYSIKDSTGKVAVDVFNLDTNDADVHGMSQICCQCYGYSNNNNNTNCDNVHEGNSYCAGGDDSLYSACSTMIQGWADDSRTQLTADLKTSTATWKIVNTHYNPYNHYSEDNMKKWFTELQGSGVQLWINGHTHGEKHDYSASLKTHFVENGAGGGIASESGSPIPTYAASYVQQFWAYAGENYGFFSMQASTDWLKIEFVSYPKGWMAPSSGFQASQLPDVQTQHCWYIPADGGKGQACDPSAEYPPLMAPALSS